MTSGRCPFSDFRFWMEGRDFRDPRVSASESAFRVDKLKYESKHALNDVLAQKMISDYLLEITPHQARAKLFWSEHESCDVSEPCPLFVEEEMREARKKRKRSMKLQKKTIDDKLRKVEKTFVRACENERLTYLQAMRVCDIMKGRFSDFKGKK